MAKRVTLKAISERCGVSHVAVGAALGTHSSASRVRLSPEKALEIRTVAREMGYQENRLAQAFRSQKTHTVGVLVRVLSNPAKVNYLIDCVHRELQSRGYFTHMWPFYSRFDLVERGMSELAGWQVDGLLISHLFASDDRDGRWSDVESWLEKMRMPLVLLESDIPTKRDVPRIYIDLEGAAMKATRHLIGLGHRRLAYIGNGEGRDVSRYAAAESAASEFAEDAEMVYLHLDRQKVTHPTLELVESTQALAARLLEMEQRPTAYICSTDAVGAALTTHLQRGGVQVPEDVSVIGFDNAEAALLGATPLTTFEPPMEQAARLAADRLIQGIEHEKLTAAPVRLAAEFIERESTGPSREQP